MSQYGTGSIIPEPPPFINHTIADVNAPKPATRSPQFARFARSSTRQSNMVVSLRSESQLQLVHSAILAQPGGLERRNKPKTSGEFNVLHGVPPPSGYVAVAHGTIEGNAFALSSSPTDPRFISNFASQTSGEFNVLHGVPPPSGYVAVAHGTIEGNAFALSTSPIDPRFISDFASQNFSDRTMSQYQTLASSPSETVRTIDQGPSSGPGPS